MRIQYRTLNNDFDSILISNNLSTNQELSITCWYVKIRIISIFPCDIGVWRVKKIKK